MGIENITIVPGQIRLSNAEVEFKVLRIEGQRVFCQTVGQIGEWSSDLNYLQHRSKFVRFSDS